MLTTPTQRAVREVYETTWNVVVVGAGPAGSVAAWSIAQTGASVLLIDRSIFPRPKVCGCCLGPIGISVLQEMDLLHHLERTELHYVEIVAAGRAFQLPLPRTITLSRESLDLCLLKAAEKAGAVILPGHTARIRDSRVWLNLPGEPRELKCTAIVDARGLQHAATTRSNPNALVGLGTTTQSSAPLVRSATLRMVTHQSGYLGVAPLPDGRFAIAAAVRAGAIRNAGSKSSVLRDLLTRAGVTNVNQVASAMRGVPQLRTRHVPQQGPVFRVGDAARFVEPITGEGMSWAMTSGRAVADPITRYLDDPTAPPQWPAQHARLLRHSFTRCAAVSALVHHPRALRMALAALHAWPDAGHWILAKATGRLHGCTL